MPISVAASYSLYPTLYSPHHLPCSHSSNVCTCQWKITEKSNSNLVTFTKSSLEHYPSMPNTTSLLAVSPKEENKDPSSAFRGKTWFILRAMEWMTYLWIVVGLISGAFAGTIVDIVLFPLDTLKTRLQSRSSVVWSSQLFRGIYRGIGPAVAASAPAGAAFFGTYEFTKRVVSDWLSERYQVFGHMLAAIAGDVAGSTVRVPFEIIKQNLQANIFSSSRQAVYHIVQRQGLSGLYRGWFSLIVREIPFDIIEFPLYEYLKKRWKTSSDDLETWQSAVCGCVAGAVAAALTTPLDVAKTRVMLQGTNTYRGIVSTLLHIAKEEGITCLFSGMIPRVLWIGLGGAIFFGSFETCKRWLLLSSPRHSLQLLRGGHVTTTDEDRTVDKI